ncbi:serine hydrolase [Paenibacillus thiaminolyticus]|uniref:serine hydrolase n=1 Tax=Paenibacillus thiaminolyticus TaxID=49283 RepID=UPI0035A6B21E
METKRERLERLFSKLEEQGGMSGVFLAAEQGEIIYQAAFGEADLATGRQITTGSVFDLASLAKPFTAAGIMVLAEEGKLGYDDPVAQWLPELPYPGITVRQLLCHTSGLPDFMELFFEHWDRKRIATNADVLAMLAEHRPPVYFEPNESWLYSNTGYVLLAMIIERSSGRTFADFMRERVFLPSGMNASRIYSRRVEGDVMDNYAYGYVYDHHSSRYEQPDLVPETQYVVYLDGIQGDGAMSSNVHDLIAFDRALQDGKLVSGPSLEQAYAPVRLNNGETFDYGFGWILEDKEGKGYVVSHSGGWPGYASLLNHYLEADMTLIYLRNREQDVELEQKVIEAAEQILFDQPYEIPQRPLEKQMAAVDTDLYNRYAGWYQQEDGGDTLMSVSIEDGRLYLQVAGKVRVELYPASDTRFFVRMIPVEVKFVVEAGTERAEKMVIVQDGYETHAVRIQ